MIVVLFGALTFAGGLIWVERRLLALFQDRYGPNRVGPFGLLQGVADMIKIFMKEDWIPPFADKPVFVLAPAVILVTVLMSFAVIAFAPGFVVADLNIGLLFFLAMSSLGVYSVALAGWSSNNKYALLGGMRAAAQMLSYEVFMGLSLMGVVMLAGSFNLSEIVKAQQRLWFCVPQFARPGDLLHRRPRRDAPAAVRPARGGERAGRRLPLGVLGHEVRHVLHRRVPRHHADLGADRDAVLRRLARAPLRSPPHAARGSSSRRCVFICLFILCGPRCRGRGTTS